MFMLGAPPLKKALVNPLHPENAHLEISVTLSGIVTLVKPAQLPNAYSPMEVTLLGIVTLVNPLHPWNDW
jgi:hypothetical protein